MFGVGDAIRLQGRKCNAVATFGPTNAATFAHSLIARVLDDGMKSSASSPTRGVNRTIDRIWSIAKLPGIAHHDITFVAPGVADWGVLTGVL